MNVPKHVAIIMSGSDKWALKKGLIVKESYIEEYKNLEKLIIHAFDIGIGILTVYSFFDNDNNLKFLKFLKSKIEKFNKRNIKIVFSGEIYNLDDKIVSEVVNIINKTNSNNKILNICLNYNGQKEILYASKKLAIDINNGLDMCNFDVKDFYKYLYNDLPLIDLLIVTGGEHNLNNFMLYQISNAEIYFTNTLFPDFQKSEFNKALFTFLNKDDCGDLYVEKNS